MKKLLKLRKERNLSTRKIAEFFNVSKATYNQWENEKAEPKISMLLKLADFFCVSVDYLIGASEERGERQRVNESNDEVKNEILELYEQLNDEGKSLLLNQAKMITKFQKESAKKEWHA